jgi:ArsR family transcriptional regulator
MRDELFGPGLSVHAIGGFLDPDWILGDLGCGTGQMTMAVAPFVKHVIAVDGSGEMLQAAKRRLQGHENVELRRGELESVPIDDHSLDATVVALVLHHVPDPARVITEGARVLKTGGRILVVDMLPHDREEFRRQMGHVWLGFAEDQVTRWLAAAGFTRTRVVALAPLPQAKGPGLFVASGTRSAAP